VGLRGLFADEDVGGVGFAIAIGVLQDADGIALTAATAVAAVVDAFGDPDPAGVVDIEVGGIVEVGRGGPEGDFEIVGEMESGRGEGVGGDRSGIEGGCVGIRGEGWFARFERRFLAFGFGIALCVLSDERGAESGEAEEEEGRERAHGIAKELSKFGGPCKINGAVSGERLAECLVSEMRKALRR
jgi:hypothetical protein